ncbi:Stp1/IreP family PP2C-type Ser/Thr phosphatase [Alkalihalobacillus trypoxylicola]|uniref:Stp1/IreP family PP2C-type Ser/Thr phosphatase n=1 Tax=Alkalihalobacillus trypoxylicola TaxID=519424 RepID=UPI001183A577|nr:Stp1/IreP family PP2C-type Ser/Thr phosphatase [Alkalihalobacillus trypoxylicola]
MAYTFKTDTGQIRTHNEDNGGIFVNEHGTLAIVADGMGGHLAGDVASEMTRAFFEEAWRENTELLSVKEAENWLREKVYSVNEKLYQHSITHSDCQGMGTTIVAAICMNDFMTLGHIGDSRIYVQNEFGFSQKTEDHTLVHELVRTGQITEKEAENHPRKNVILRALGTEREISIDIQSLQIEGGELLLLCSDGLTNKLEQKEMRELLDVNESIEEAANSFIEIANERGGEDNITVAIVLYPKVEEESSR